MTVTYTWEVTGIKTTTVNDMQNVVIQTYWKKIGTDENGNQGVFSGATPFSVNNIPVGTSFIPFSDLTEEYVLSWIQSLVTDKYALHVDEQIMKQIDNKKNLVIDTNLPWKLKEVD